MFIIGCLGNKIINMAALRNNIKNFRSHSSHARVLNNLISPTPAEVNNQNTRKYDYEFGNKNTNKCKQLDEDDTTASTSTFDKKRRSQSTPPEQKSFVNNEEEVKKSLIEIKSTNDGSVSTAIKATKNTQQPHGIIPSIKSAAKKFEHFLHSNGKNQSENEMKLKNFINQMKEGTSTTVKNCIRTITSLPLLEKSVTVPVPYIPEKALHIVEHKTKTVKSVPFSLIKNKEFELLQLRKDDRLKFKKSQSKISSTKLASLLCTNRLQNKNIKVEQNHNSIISAYSMFVQTKNNPDLMDIVNLIGNDNHCLNNITKCSKSNLNFNYEQKRYFQSSTNRFNEKEKKNWKNIKKCIKLNNNDNDNNNNGSTHDNVNKVTNNNENNFEILSCESANKKNEVVLAGLHRDQCYSKEDKPKIFSFFDNCIINKRNSGTDYAANKLKKCSSENSLNKFYGGFFSFNAEKKYISFPCLNSINNSINYNNPTGNNLYAQHYSTTSISSPASSCSVNKLLLKPYEETCIGYSTANIMNSNLDKGIPNEVLHSVLTTYLNDTTHSKEKLSRSNSKNVFDTKSENSKTSDSNYKNNNFNYEDSTNSDNKFMFETKIKERNQANNLMFRLNENMSTKMDAFLKNEMNLKKRVPSFNLGRPSTSTTSREYEKNSQEAELTELFVKHTYIERKTKDEMIIKENVKPTNYCEERQSDNLLTEHNKQITVHDDRENISFSAMNRVKEKKNLMKIASIVSSSPEKVKEIKVPMCNTHGNRYKINEMSDILNGKNQTPKENLIIDKTKNVAGGTNFIARDPYTQRISERLKMNEICNNEAITNFLRKPKSFSDFGSKKTKDEQNIFLKYMIDNADKKGNNDFTNDKIEESISMTDNYKYKTLGKEIKYNANKFSPSKEKKEEEINEVIEKELMPIRKNDNLSNKYISASIAGAYKSENKDENKKSLISEIFNNTNKKFLTSNNNKNITLFDNYNEINQQRSVFERKIEECIYEIGEKYLRSKEILNKINLNKKSSKGDVKMIESEDEMNVIKASNGIEVNVSLSMKLSSDEVKNSYEEIKNIKKFSEKLQSKEDKTLKECNMIVNLDQYNQQSVCLVNENVTNENKPQQILGNTKEVELKQIEEKIVDSTEVKNKSLNIEVNLRTPTKSIAKESVESKAAPLNQTVKPDMDIIVEKLNKIYEEYEKKHAEDNIKSNDFVLNKEKIRDKYIGNLNFKRPIPYDLKYDSRKITKYAHVPYKKSDNSEMNGFFAENNLMYLNKKYLKSLPNSAGGNGNELIKKEKFRLFNDNKSQHSQMTTSQHYQLDPKDIKIKLTKEENITESDRIETETNKEIKFSHKQNFVDERNSSEYEINGATKQDVKNTEKGILHEKVLENNKDQPLLISCKDEEKVMLKNNVQLDKSVPKNDEKQEFSVSEASSIKNTTDNEYLKSVDKNNEATAIVLSDQNTSLLPVTSNEIKTLSQKILEQKRNVMKSNENGNKSRKSETEDADDDDVKDCVLNITQMKQPVLFENETKVVKKQSDNKSISYLQRSVSPSKYDKQLSGNYITKPEKKIPITFEDIKKRVHLETKKSDDNLKKLIEMNKKQHENENLKTEASIDGEEPHTMKTLDVDESIPTASTKTDYVQNLSLGMNVTDKPLDAQKGRLSALLLLSDRTRKLITAIRSKQNISASVNEPIDNLAATSFAKFHQNDFVDTIKNARSARQSLSVSLSPTVSSGSATPKKQMIEKVKRVEYINNYRNKIKSELQKEEKLKELVKKELKIDDAQNKLSFDKINDHDLRVYIKETRNREHFKMKENQLTLLNENKFKETFKNDTELLPSESGNYNRNQSNILSIKPRFVDLNNKKIPQKTTNINKQLDSSLSTAFTSMMKPVYNYNSATEKFKNLKNKITIENGKELKENKQSFEKDMSHYDFSTEVNRGENVYDLGNKPKLNYSTVEKSPKKTTVAKNPDNAHIFDQFHLNIRQSLSNQYKKTNLSDKNFQYKINSASDNSSDRRIDVDFPAEKIKIGNLTEKENVKEYAVISEKMINQEQTNLVNQSPNKKNGRTQNIIEPVRKKSTDLNKTPGIDDTTALNKINIYAINKNIDKINSTKSSEKSAKGSSSNMTANTDEGSTMGSIINHLKDKTYKLFSSTNIIDHFTKKRNPQDMSPNETYGFLQGFNSLNDVNNTKRKSGDQNVVGKIITDFSKNNSKENKVLLKPNEELKKLFAENYKNHNDKNLEVKIKDKKEDTTLSVKVMPNNPVSNTGGGTIKPQSFKAAVQRNNNSYNKIKEVDKTKYKSKNDFSLLSKTGSSKLPQMAPNPTQTPPVTYFSSKFIDKPKYLKQTESSEKKRLAATKKVESWVTKNTAGNDYVDYSKSIDRSNKEYLNNLEDVSATNRHLWQKTGANGRNKVGASKIAVKSKIPTLMKVNKVMNTDRKNDFINFGSFNNSLKTIKETSYTKGGKNKSTKKNFDLNRITERQINYINSSITPRNRPLYQKDIVEHFKSNLLPTPNVISQKSKKMIKYQQLATRLSGNSTLLMKHRNSLTQSNIHKPSVKVHPTFKKKKLTRLYDLYNNNRSINMTRSSTKSNDSGKHTVIKNKITGTPHASFTRGMKNLTRTNLAREFNSSTAHRPHQKTQPRFNFFNNNNSSDNNNNDGNDTNDEHDENKKLMKYFQRDRTNKETLIDIKNKQSSNKSIRRNIKTRYGDNANRYLNKNKTSNLAQGSSSITSNKIKNSKRDISDYLKIKNTREHINQRYVTPEGKSVLLRNSYNNMKNFDIESISKRRLIFKANLPSMYNNASFGLKLHDK